MKLITDSNTIAKLNEFGSEFVGRLKAELWNQHITASGNLADSLEYVISDESDGTHITVLGDPYFIYAEKGRRAGKVPYSFTTILEKWIEDKGLQVPQGLSVKQFASKIAWKIKRYGSLRYRTQSPADVVEPVASEMIPRLNDILENRVMMYVNDELFNWV